MFYKACFLIEGAILENSQRIECLGSIPKYNILKENDLKCNFLIQNRIFHKACWILIKDSRSHSKVGHSEKASFAMKCSQTDENVVF